MKQKLLKTMLLLCALVVGSSSAWGDPTVLFHETFGDNTGSARAWNDSYSVKSGVSAVYSGITGYTVSNAKQSKNTMGSNQSGLNQTTAGTDAYIIIGPLNVASYESLAVTYQWNATSTKKTYTTKLEYATSSGGSYTEVSGTGTGATTFVERSYSLPAAAQVSTLYLKITWNTSNTSAFIDEVELTGIESGGDPSISASNVNIVYSATSGSIAYIVSNPAGDGVMTATRIDGDWLTVGAVSAGSVAFTCSENTGDDRTATVRLTYTYNTSETVTKDVTITQAFALKTYTLASSLTSGKTYVITGGKDDGTVQIMAGQNSNNRATVSGTVSGTTLTTANRPAELVVYGPDASGFYTLYDAANGYLYAASNSSNYLRSQATNDLNGKWDIDIDGESKEANVVAQGSNSNKNMRFNSTLFSCYGDGSSVTDLVYFFEKADAPVATTTSVTLNGSGYATFATTTALDFLDADNASFSAWQITAANSSTGVITFSQIDKHIAAGKGILLKGSADDDINLNILPTGGDALSTNKLVGFTSATDVAADTYYGLSGNKFVKVNAGTVKAGKALLPASEVSAGVKSFTFIFEGATGVRTVEKVSAAEAEAIFNLAGLRIQKPQRGINIINGRKVVVK